ncbi:MAG: iron reductase [Mycobacterium sp.]|uniref:iron reductase n=1 Tax=Mycobacterium sp. TaxID=1785 RepID=UPI003C747D01
MTTLIDDPLIAAMAIDRRLPLHESSQRLRELYPQCPRVYGVAVLADVSVRRWWPLESALSTDRLQTMFDAAAADMDRRSAARQLAATLVHTVIGRVVALVVLEARAWDTGLENLWVHVDSDGVIDWAGVVDPTVRVLPEDSYFADDDGDCVLDGVVRLPSEAALTTWVAHRCHRTLEPLFAQLHAVSGGAIPVAAMWHIAGSMVVAAATQVPQLAGADELAAMRRGQAVLDAMVGFGLPVRGPLAARRGRRTSCEIRAALPMLLASSDR